MDTVVVTRLLLSKKEDEASAAQRLLTGAARSSQAEREEAVAVLLAVLEGGERRSRRNKWVKLSSLLALNVICVVGGWFLIAFGHSRRFPVILFFFPAQIANVVSTFLLSRKRCSPGRARAGLALAEHDDLRAVGPLVEAFGANVPEAPIPVVSGALKRLLPRVSPGDADLLNDRQRNALNTLLCEWNPETSAKNPDEAAEGLIVLLRLAALVGDKGTEFAVAAVRGRQATKDHDRHVVGVACVCIEEIRARLDTQAAAAGGPSRFRARQ